MLSQPIGKASRYIYQMNTSEITPRNYKWFSAGSVAVLLISFFLPWVSWKDELVNGFFMPAGKFFSLSDQNFGLSNPFPQFGFAVNIFWLIPFLAILIFVFIFLKRKTIPFTFITAALSLMLAMIFVLFSRTLIDLGVGSNIYSMLKPGIYLHTIAAITLILTSFPVKKYSTKIIWLAMGPLLAYGGYKIGEKYVMSQNFSNTETLIAEYSVNAIDLIREFAANDSMANKKYQEKIISVNGNVSQVERMSDSTTNIRFDDITGSYIIFSFDKEHLNNLKDIKAGDSLSLKGSCSGSILSQILGTTSISFKRSTLNKIKQQ